MKLQVHLLVLGMFIGVISQAQNNTRTFSSYFNPEKKYLVLPVKNGAQKRNAQIWVDGVLSRYFDIELAEEAPDWYAYLQIDQWKGKKVELRVDKISATSKVFSPIRQSDIDTNSNVYGESLRPQFHFSAKHGWINDPNGMVFYNGEYHLFYQHNPYGRAWGNMTWGHAVSKDLVHWEHLDDAIHPHQGGTVFSGGAVVDSFNTSKLGSEGKPAMVAFHTGASGWGQYMSWTTDGRSFQHFGQAVVPRINKDNRDPKVIWHEPTKSWVMVLWVELGDNEQHSMQFLSSPDLKNWTPTSIFMGGIGNDRYLFECPEFYELPVDGSNGEKKWVLTGANTQYAIGTFDGKTFKPEEERLQGQYGRDFYAPQTFSNEPTGRRIEMGWWRTKTGIGSSHFEHSMSLPLEHRLVQTAKGIRLTRMPVKELEKLRVKTHSFKKLSLKDNSTNPLKNINAELAEIRLEIEPGKAASINFDLRGLPIVYNVKAGELVVDSVKAPVPLVNGKLKLVVYVDRTGVEIFANDGLVYMPINYNLPAANRSFGVAVKGGMAKFAFVDVYELKSIL
jgi:sucrose-6-phosphate hydrolase SacC (GH32 family)